ncbi:MAG: hypothetical protein PHR69_06275, partial [Sphaerochaeta sp.]|nr:hypothetical protein [Sphaerochaeta sp.]
KVSEYILAYLENGKIYISDEYGTGNTSHASDVFLEGKESKRVTITFSPPSTQKTSMTRSSERVKNTRRYQRMALPRPSMPGIGRKGKQLR